MKDTLPQQAAGFAWFLDLDGTLIEIAPSPQRVRVSPRLVPILRRLQRKTGGALAIISGRPIAAIHHLLKPLQLPAAGLHGMERLTARGDYSPPPDPTPATQAIHQALQAFACDKPGLMIEDKGPALALHYRAAPHLQQSARDFIHRLMTGFPDHRLIDGKMVLEIKPKGYDKGQALQAFLSEPPFHGLIPIYAGDDATDEDGFAAVNGQGGRSLRIGRPEAGSGSSYARHHLPSVAAFLDYLDKISR